MNMESEIGNWIAGGQLPKAAKIKLVRKLVGLVVISIGAGLIHPALLIIMAGFFIGGGRDNEPT